MHTPHSSSTPLTQQMPDGGSVLIQQVPCTSTATPLPPHTPHASSSTPASQHRPNASTTAPSPSQHLPVTASMKPRQHTPLTSTTPSSQGTVLYTGTPQSVPPHWGPHAHTPPRVGSATVHTLCGLPQSASVWHTHKDDRSLSAGAQVSVAGGLTDASGPPSLALWHAVSGTTSPPLLLHITVRLRFHPPKAQVAGAPCCTPTHGPHGPTSHVARVSGHGKVLQGRDSCGCCLGGGGAWGSATHMGEAQSRLCVCVKQGWNRMAGSRLSTLGWSEGGWHGCGVGLSATMHKAQTTLLADEHPPRP